MRVWWILVPVIGACVAAGTPLARHATQQRDEAVAISTLRLIHEAQRRFEASSGGYLTEVATLASGCSGTFDAVSDEVFNRLTRAGYVLELRAAAGAATTGQDCHGRPIATDYYVSARPRTAREAAETAFAGRADGELFLFVDGVPPRESDMTSGLAITVDAMKSFRIP